MTGEERAQYIFEELMENPEFRKVFVGAITDAVNEVDEVVKVINALQQEPCTDAISRANTIDEISHIIFDHPLDGYEDGQLILETIQDMPPVTPAEKTGKWIDGKCNRCGTHAPYWAMASTYYCSDYCPNCGAKMQEVEE